MALRSKDDAAELRRLARALYFSNEAIDSFLKSATAAEARCVSDLITAELETRERNKRAACSAVRDSLRSSPSRATTSRKSSSRMATARPTCARLSLSMRHRTLCSMARPDGARPILR